MKGLPLQAVQQKHTVDLWISSPTGDSSDSFVFNIVCHNAEQARSLTEAYNKMIENIRFAVPVETQETITKLCQENEELHMWDYANRDNIKRLSEQLENANQKIASLTATLIRHYQEA